MSFPKVLVPLAAVPAAAPQGKDEALPLSPCPAGGDPASHCHPTQLPHGHGAGEACLTPLMGKWSTSCWGKPILLAGSRGPTRGSADAEERMINGEELILPVLVRQPTAASDKEVYVECYQAATQIMPQLIMRPHTFPLPF